MSSRDPCNCHQSLTARLLPSLETLEHMRRECRRRAREEREYGTVERAEMFEADAKILEGMIDV